MIVTQIVGTTDPNARAALIELIAGWTRDGTYTGAMLDRIPYGRVEIHVVSDGDHDLTGRFIIEASDDRRHRPFTFHIANDVFGITSVLVSNDAREG